MRLAPVRPFGVLAGALLVGCAYFNGLYNANRLAGDARRAEREGRQGEARSLWAGAAVKAESVAVRYPDSRYRDDALLLWGDALRQSGACRMALRPYAIAADSSPDPLLRDRANLGRAECYLALGFADSAIAAAEATTSDTTGPLASDAAYWRGRAALQRGDPEAAARSLARSAHPDAPFHLALALLAQGAVERATETLEARVPGRFDEGKWRSTLDSLGFEAPTAATKVVDGLMGRSGLTPGQRARLLVDDGDRWKHAGDADRARARFTEALRVAPDSADGQLGEVRLALAALRDADDLAAIGQARARLEAAARAGGSAQRAAQNPLRLLRLASTAVDRGDVPLADLLRFAAGELLRDSIEAPSLAAKMFFLVGREHSESVLAPKALLAAAAIDSARADSVYRLLLSDYPTSPYTRAVRGEKSERFAVVEDSVRSLLDRARTMLDRPDIMDADETELRGRRRP